jgi:PAS domain S-box-containing protein
MVVDSITVLAVDDHKDNLIALNAIIKDAFPGAIVLTALNGQEGISLALQEDPDVILLDIIMPEMDGYEVCRRLKANDKTVHIPVLFLTAIKTDKNSRIKALDVGGEAFLSKPIEEEELIAQIRAMVKIKTANLMQRLEKERLTKMVADRTIELEQELNERKLADEKIIKHNKALQILNEYSFQIADLLYDDVFPFAIYHIQKLIDTKAAWINVYDEKKSELEIRYTTLEDYTNPQAVQILGKNQIGFRIPVSKEQHVMMLKETISRQMSLHELSFGAIPEIAANSIERIFGFGWFIGVVLMHRDKLIGTITIAGSKDQEIPELEEMKMFSNITADALIRKRAEKELRAAAVELRQRNEFIQAVIDNLPIGLALNSISTGKKLYMNKQFEEIYGWPGEDISDVDTFFEKVYPEPEYRKWIKEKVIADIATGDPERMIWDNLMITTTSGEHRYIYARNIPLPDQDLMVSTVRDITDRTLAVNALKLNEARLANAQRVAHIGSWEADVDTDNLYWSEETYRIFGVEPTAENANMKLFYNHVHPDDIRKIEIARDYAYKNKVPYMLDHRIILPDGSERIVHEQAEIVYDEFGNPQRMVGTVQDITERMNAEKEKDKLEHQFQHVQKMESIGQLAGGVAHDLNNLLTPILGYGDMLLDGFTTDDPRKESVEQILLAGEKARDLIRQLLAFSRKQMLEFQPIDINSTIQGFSTLLRRTIRENISINTLLMPDLPKILGDIGQLEQVIMNLAVNAQDAMLNGGNLIISTKAVDIDEEHASLYPGLKSGKYVLLSIIDSGQGMTSETKQHIFEPFFTTKEKGKGTGLGLATTYGIVKQHGGYIDIISELTKGTTCDIYLPVTSTKVVEKNESTEKPGLDTRGTEVILLVEDNEIVRKLASVILQQQGYTVLSAEDGPHALKMMAEYHRKIDMVVTDVVMPEMSGKELCEIITAQYPDMKILYMSGYAEDAIIHQGVLDEGVEFIHKPFTVQMLATKVKNILGS